MLDDGADAERSVDGKKCQIQVHPDALATQHWDCGWSHQAGLFVSNNSPPWGMPTWTFYVLFRNVKTETQRSRGNCFQFQQGATLTKLFTFMLRRIQLFAASWTVWILCPWNFPGKNTGVGCHFLLQGIFPTQGSNQYLASSASAGGFSTTSTNWEALFTFKQELFPFQPQQNHEQRFLQSLCIG